ncbi:hypothetical protein RDI58_027407 [Solanum bulbocastanum]|uniref:Uncharacterized protein n=1 Tax=Solanum bulbocastanum TaxID=147425 RepID=A0AAN8T3B0_SOLBU
MDLWVSNSWAKINNKTQSPIDFRPNMLLVIFLRFSISSLTANFLDSPSPANSLLSFSPANSLLDLRKYGTQSWHLIY